MKSNIILSYWNLADSMIKYNLRIVFANKFIWFMLASVLFYIGLSVIYVFSVNVSSMEDLYGVFLFSGILLVFYPAVFSIQNDQDARTIEILFGIPNYRYKVWFVRILLIYAVTFIILLIFTSLSSFFITRFNILLMTSQVMVPVLFLGTMAFMLSTVIRNGNGTAVVMIIFGIIFMILKDTFARSIWNVFLNPFEPARGMSEIAWKAVATDNRIALISITIFMFLIALYNLQKREKFM